MMGRLGIQEKSSISQEEDRMRCDLSWTFTDERGYPKVTDATAYGAHKKAALAHARMTLLGQLGVEEIVSSPERAGARKIQELILSRDLGSAAQEAVSFIQNSSPEAWALVLPQLWRSILASYQSSHVENLVRALDTAGTDGMSMIFNTSFCGREL